MDKQQEKRRICRFVNHQQQDADLKRYEDIIIATIENIVPGKHPRVFSDHFSITIPTQGEAVKIGSALSQLTQLQPYGITVTQYRLFRGQSVEASMDTENALQKQRGKAKQKSVKGGPKT